VLPTRRKSGRKESRGNTRTSTDKKFNLIELLAKVRNLPFDRLGVNGLRFKLFSFSVRGELVEPQKNTFARVSIV
jgi:hypothetical protein